MVDFLEARFVRGLRLTAKGTAWSVSVSLSERSATEPSYELMPSDDFERKSKSSCSGTLNLTTGTKEEVRSGAARGMYSDTGLALLLVGEDGDGDRDWSGVASEYGTVGPIETRFLLLGGEEGARADRSRGLRP